MESGGLEEEASSNVEVISSFLKCVCLCVFTVVD